MNETLACNHETEAHHRKKQAGDNQILTFAPKHMHSNVTEQDQLLSSTVEKHDIHMLMCFNFSIRGLQERNYMVDVNSRTSELRSKEKH